MSELKLSRKLVLRLMHEALIGNGGTIADPAASYAAGTEAPAAADFKGQPLHLRIGLDTKGVLKLRAWRLENGAPVEQLVHIPENT